MRVLKTILIAAVCAAFAGCEDARRGGEYTADFFAMDTVMRVTAYGNESEKAVRAVENRIGELEKMWSATDAESEIFAINHSGGEPVAVHKETAELVLFAREIAEKTGGALEPTIYPVLTAWGFTVGENRVPSDEEIAELLENVGYERISVAGNEVRTGENMMLDLGAVAKGEAADEAARILKENGISSALINLGGNVRLIGGKPDGSDWRLGLKDPLGSGYAGVLNVSDCTVVTSGSYERYFTADDGTVYGHIIDPSSGYPADNGLLSVTIIAKEGRLCDALSTALFVMGEEKARAYWRENGGFDMILITRDEVIVTGGIAEMFSLDSGHEYLRLTVI